jgi:hypothetical protein
LVAAFTYNKEIKKMNYAKAIYQTAKKIGWKYLLIRSWYHLKRKILSYGDWYFDISHKVNTCGQISKFDLDLCGSSISCLIGYEPTPIKVIHRVLEDLCINYSEFTFIDFGSGKGRVLLIASLFPFSKVLGLELATSLHNVAKDNINRWRHHSQKCFNIKSHNINATQFALPPEPLVLFFSHHLREKFLTMYWIKLGLI